MPRTRVERLLNGALSGAGPHAHAAPGSNVSEKGALSGAGSGGAGARAGAQGKHLPSRPTTFGTERAAILNCRGPIYIYIWIMVKLGI